MERLFVLHSQATESPGWRLRFDGGVSLVHFIAETVQRGATPFGVAFVLGVAAAVGLTITALVMRQPLWWRCTSRSGCPPPELPEPVGGVSSGLPPADTG
jgi:hypothetical protein